MLDTIVNLIVLPNVKKLTLESMEVIANVPHQAARTSAIRLMSTRVVKNIVTSVGKNLTMNSMNELQSVYDDLVNIILKYDHAYWALNVPMVADHDYDQAVERLKALEKRGVKISPYSPTQRVSGKLLA